MMQVTIPDGLGPGSVFSVFQQDGQQVQIRVPEDVKPGMAMEVAVKPPLHTNPVVHTEAFSVNAQPNPTQHTTHTTMGWGFWWHSSLLLVSWVLFFFNMGAPFWLRFQGLDALRYSLISSGTCQSNNLNEVPQAGCEMASTSLGLDTTVEVTTWDDVANGCIHSSRQSRTAFVTNSNLLNCGSNGYDCICAEQLNAGSGDPFYETCTIYLGPWGTYFSGCQPVYEDGYIECKNQGLTLQGQPYAWCIEDSDNETWRGGATVAFLFGFFAVILKFVAWKGDSPSKKLLIASTILSSIACLGAFISWGKVADYFDDFVNNELTFSVNFGFQIVASFLIIPSIVMDIMEIVGGATV